MGSMTGSTSGPDEVLLNNAEDRLDMWILDRGGLTGLF